MSSTIAWELYRTFLAVLREGSLSGAARALGITQPTAGRHIAALEAQLNLALFTRSPHGLIPTDMALQLQSYAEDLDSTAAALERMASSHGEGVRGVVRISASQVVGVEVLPPILAQLRAQHPQLKVELVLTNQVQDLLRREADIAVRMLRPRQEQLVARKIGDIALGLHAHQSYLARRGVPASPNELAQHDLIGFDEETAFVRAAGKHFPGIRRADFAFASDNDLAQLALLRSGAGIAICQVALARRDAALQRLLPEISLQLETWITMHEDLRNSPHCRVTFDALVEGLQAYLQN